jgi:predicted Na+-dependent transporter
MTETLVTLLKISIGVLMVAIGMGSTLSDLTYLWRRPGLLLRSLLAMYVLVPAAAFLLVKVLPIAPGVKAALLVLAVSAGAPLLPKKLGALASDAYVFSLVVTSSLLAIVLVPGWVALLAAHFGVATELKPGVVAAAVTKAFLIPLAIGMVIRALLPELGERLSDWLIAAAGLVLAVCGLVLLVTHWELFAGMTWQGITALVLLMLIALAIGHLLGGPSGDDRTALAIACATRHIGIAVLVAAAFPGPGTAVLIAGYVVTSALVSIPYLEWRRALASKPEKSSRPAGSMEE